MIPKAIQTIEFPLRFSQEEVSCLEVFLCKNPRHRVANACMVLKGATKRSLAEELELHPSRITQYLQAEELPRDVRERLIRKGLPAAVLAPERPPRY